MPYEAGNSTCSTLKKKKTLIQSKKKINKNFQNNLINVRLVNRQMNEQYTCTSLKGPIFLDCLSIYKHVTHT